MKSGVFSDLAIRLKHKEDTIGSGIGRAVGVKLSGALETATAPALDNAATKFSEVVKSAASALDQSLETENESIDAIALRDTERIDTVTQARLNQVDQMVGARLQQLQSGATSLLDREARIVDGALKQENNIANNALDRVAAISGQSLSKLQEIESDASDQVNAALQDQIPFAASQVAHEFVVAAVVVALILALFGFAGISLWRNLQQARDGSSSMSETLKVGLSGFWRTLPQDAAVVVLPTLLIAAVSLGGYEGYLRSSQAMRVSRLEKAANLLESTGEYGVAAQLRKRALDGSDSSGSARKEFAYEADQWLSDLTQKPSVDVSDLVKRLTLLEENATTTSNPDLQAASLYLHAEVYGDFNSASANQYRQAFLDSKSPKPAPFLGKLVLMTQIKAELDRSGMACDRVAAALNISRELSSLYPNYANGHILTALLLGMQADALGNDQDSEQGEALRREVSSEIGRASVLDPDLMRIVRLNSSELPAELVKDLDENPKSAGLASRLSKYAVAEVDPLARSILTSDVLTHQAVDSAILRASCRGVGERRVARRIALLRASGANPQQHATVMVEIAQQFFAIDDYLAAEHWAESARRTLNGARDADPGLSKRIDALTEAVAHSKMSIDLAAVI